MRGWEGTESGVQGIHRRMRFRCQLWLVGVQCEVTQQMWCASTNRIHLKSD